MLSLCYLQVLPRFRVPVVSDGSQDPVSGRPERSGAAIASCHLMFVTLKRSQMDIHTRPGGIDYIKVAGNLLSIAQAKGLC